MECRKYSIEEIQNFMFAVSSFRLYQKAYKQSQRLCGRLNEFLSCVIQWKIQAIFFLHEADEKVDSHAASALQLFLNTANEGQNERTHITETLSDYNNQQFNLQITPRSSRIRSMPIFQRKSRSHTMAGLHLPHQEIRIKDHHSLGVWKRQLRAILLTKCLWHIVSGESKEPGQETQYDWQDLDHHLWKIDANKVLGWMMLTMDDYTRQSIDRYDHPLQVMENLFTRFGPKFLTLEEFLGTKPEFASTEDGNESENTKFGGEDFQSTSSSAGLIFVTPRRGRAEQMAPGNGKSGEGQREGESSGSTNGPQGVAFVTPRDGRSERMAPGDGSSSGGSLDHAVLAGGKSQGGLPRNGRAESG